MEYDPADVDSFIAVADAIEEAFPGVVVEGNEKEDGRPGSFEIQTSEGIAIFSRLRDKALPDPEVIISRIANRANLPSNDAAGGPTCG